jgi:hypothetical protein
MKIHAIVIIGDATQVGFGHVRLGCGGRDIDLILLSE